jgi:hypothetical protein
MLILSHFVGVLFFLGLPFSSDLPPSTAIVQPFFLYLYKSKCFFFGSYLDFLGERFFALQLTKRWRFLKGGISCWLYQRQE